MQVVVYQSYVDIAYRACGADPPGNWVSPRRLFEDSELNRKRSLEDEIRRLPLGVRVVQSKWGDDPALREVTEAIPTPDLSGFRPS